MAERRRVVGERRWLAKLGAPCQTPMPKWVCGMVEAEAPSGGQGALKH